MLAKAQTPYCSRLDELFTDSLYQNRFTGSRGLHGPVALFQVTSSLTMSGLRALLRVPEVDSTAHKPTPLYGASQAPIEWLTAIVSPKSKQNYPCTSACAN